MIKTVGDLRKILKDLDDDFKLDIRIMKEIPEKELVGRKYPYPWEMIDGYLEFQDIGYFDRELCIGVYEKDDMELKKIIFKGLCDGLIKIIRNPNDSCIACQINGFWFTFIESEDKNLTPDEVYESYTKEQLAEMVATKLQELEKFNEIARYIKEFIKEKYENNKKESLKGDKC